MCVFVLFFSFALPLIGRSFTGSSIAASVCLLFALPNLKYVHLCFRLDGFLALKRTAYPSIPAYIHANTKMIMDLNATHKKTKTTDFKVSCVFEWWPLFSFPMTCRIHNATTQLLSEICDCARSPFSYSTWNASQTPNRMLVLAFARSLAHLLTHAFIYATNSQSDHHSKQSNKIRCYLHSKCSQHSTAQLYMAQLQQPMQCAFFFKSSFTFTLSNRSTHQWMEKEDRTRAREWEYHCL